MPEAGFLSPLLFLSPASSSRLMTLLLINRFSKWFVSLAHVNSPPSQQSVPNKSSDPDAHAILVRLPISICGVRPQQDLLVL